MIKGSSTFIVSLLALLLVSPIAGINGGIVVSNSPLLSEVLTDLARGDYDVEIDYAESNQCPCEITRNGEFTGEFTVSNQGTFHDTYNLSVSWTDEYNLGWDAFPNQDSVTVLSNSQETVSFTFKAPVQGIYAYDSMDFTVKATSQNSTSISDSRLQTLDVDMIYAVDVSVRDPPQSGNRGDSVYYSIEIKNVGETSEEFAIEVGDLAWEWEAQPSQTTIDLNPDDSATIALEVVIPNTAAVDEYAEIQVIARVQTSSYSYIYGFATTNTSVDDGLVYEVDIIPDAYQKQLIPGGQIIYSLYVTNAGEGVDSYDLELHHDVMSEGWGSNLSQFTIENLGPGEETVVTMNVTSPDDSVEDDWSLSHVSISSKTRNQFGDDVSGMNTSVRIPVRGLELTVDAIEKSGDPGTKVVYTVSLENTGTDPDDFSLEILRCEGCDAWGVELSQYQIMDLEDGDVFDVEFHVTLPSSARHSDSADMVVIAISSDVDVTDSISTLTKVDKVLSRTVSWDSGYLLNPGDSSFIDIEITNLGNDYQSYTFESDELPNGWSFTGVPYQTDDLDPYGGNEEFSITFTVSDDENPGFFNFTIDVILDEDNFKVAEVKVSIMIEYYAEFVLAIPVVESLGDPGATHIFSVDITNNANIEDNIELEIMMLPEGWEACILVNSICSSDISVGKGQTSSFEIQITTNDKEAANTVNGIYLTLNAISGLNDKEVHDVYFTVFTNPVYDLSVEIPADYKNGEEGDSIPFQITVTNNGNAADQVNLPFASAPANWITAFSESSFSLSPGSSKTIYLNVDIPANVNGGENLITVSVNSDQSGQSIEISFTVYIDEKAEIDVDVKTTAGDVMAGTTGNFKVRITNNGNTVEKLTLKIEGKRSSWFTLPTDSIRLEPGFFEEIIIEVKPPVMQAATEASGTLNVTLSTDSSNTIKKGLPFTVLKSDLVVDEPTVNEEEGLLPGPGIIPVILLISLLSRIVRRK